MNDEDISKITSKLTKSLATKEDINGIKDDIKEIKEDINGVKKDLGGVKKDLNGVKGDINGVKGDLKDLGILFDEKLNKRLEASEQNIIKEVGDFVTNTIIPQLDEKADKTDIDRLERKLDRIFDKDAVQDKRLKDIESIPVITHALKLY